MLDDDTHPAFLASERGSMITAPRCGTRNPPSHVRARRDHQEDRRPDDRRDAPHDISLANADVAGQFNVAVNRAGWSSAGGGDVLWEVLVAFEEGIELVFNEQKRRTR
jgi:hypothetical protein